MMRIDTLSTARRRELLAQARPFTAVITVLDRFGRLREIRRDLGPDLPGLTVLFSGLRADGLRIQGVRRAAA